MSSMRIVFHSFFVSFSVVGCLLSILWSCGKDSSPSLPAGPQDGGSVSLRIDVPGLGIATKSGAEDVLSSVTLLVYRPGQESSRALFSVSGVAVSEGVVRTYIPGDLLQSLVREDGGEATVYVVANASVDLTGATDAETVLRTLSSSPFNEDTPVGILPMWGSCTARVTDAGKTLSGAVTLERSVAKLEVRIVELSSNIVDGVSTYIPDTDHIQLVLQNGLKRGAVGGLAYRSEPSADDFYTCQVGPMEEVTDAAGGFLYYRSPAVFYTYASDWSSDEASAVTFLLVVPWSNDGGSSWVKSYYQIPVNPDGLCVRENTHYIINMKIGIVGSFEEELPVALTPSVIVQPWGTVSLVEESITESRYLVVGTTDETLENEVETTIQFASSHDCIILSRRLTRKILSSISEQDELIPESDYTMTLSNASNTIYFHHDLDNSGTSEADFAPYELTLVIAHESRPSYQREIHIRQNPMISVVAQENSDGTSSSHKGYTYVNNGTNLSYYGNGCNGLTGSNKNQNMYVITISALSEGSSYTIGDPRTRVVDNLPTAVQGSNTSTTYTYNATWSASCPSLSGGTRRLSYYHPAESSERTKDMIAPQFRVASSYGACNAHKYTNMQRRCAAYQEDGYPAGRWRLPTAAEIFYITSLSAQGTIPELFTIGRNDTDGYWCANGWVGGDANGVPTLHEDVYTGNNYVRCVYDEWFWGSEQLSSKTTFTWGDMDY